MGSCELRKVNVDFLKMDKNQKPFKKGEVFYESDQNNISYWNVIVGNSFGVKRSKN